MSDFFRPSTSPRAMKAYRCIWCGYSIEAGEVHKHQTGVYEGRWFTQRFHNECFEDCCEEAEFGGGEFMPYSADPPERLRTQP